MVSVSEKNGCAYGQICFDASMRGIGYAVTHPGTLLLAPGEFPAPEFCRALRVCRVGEARSEAGREFAAFLEKHLCVAEGRLDTPALSPALAAYLLEKKVPVLLDVAVRSVEKTPDGYAVTILSHEGVRTLSCQKVVGEKAPLRGSAYMNLLCNTKDRSALRDAADAAGVGFAPGFVPDEYIVSFPVDPGKEFWRAQEEVAEVWEKHFTPRGLLIDIVPSRFDTEPETDALTAFEEGASEKNMDTCAYQEKKEPVREENFDLVVVGAGSAGTYCALSAAEEGLHVLLVEKNPFPGGTSTAGMVGGYYHGLPGGRFEEIDALVETKNGTVYNARPHHPFIKRAVLARALADAGVTVLYGATVAEILADGKTVRGARVLTCDGRELTAFCRFLCDSTAEGYILRQIGVPSAFGRETDGTAVPFSFNRIFRSEDGFVASIGSDAGYLDPYDDAAFAEAVLRAEARCGRTSVTSVRTIWMPDLVGNREGLRFEGEYTLTLDDAVYEREVPMPLLFTESDVDCHGEDHAFCSDTYKDFYVHANLSTVALKIPVPLGSLVPRGWHGLFSACRCLSADHYVAGAVRMNRDMCRLGEAAGVAVAEAIGKGYDRLTDLSDAEYGVLVEKLNARGCFDPDPARRHGFSLKKEYIPFDWLTDPDEILSELDSDRPGRALWSCKRAPSEEIVEALKHATCACQNETGDRLRKNAAVALGLLGDADAIPVLRECVANRTDDFFLDCRRSNQMRSVIAISLLGRLGDAFIVDELLTILTDAEYEREIYHTHLVDSYLYSTRSGFNLIYFAYLTFTVEALSEIAARHPEPEIRAKIAVGARDLLSRRESVTARIDLARSDLAIPVQIGRLFDRAGALASLI